MNPAAIRAPVALARDAREADGPALIELSAACPMKGDVGLCVNRAPDFFALNRLEGDRWRVGVVEGRSGAIAGCVAVAERLAYLHGRPTHIVYVGDLKVHPAHRGGVVADELTRYAREACRAAGGDSVPTLLTILAGNQPMERRTAGPRGLPRFTRFATIRSHSVPLLWRRRPPATHLRVFRGTAADVEEMADLWQRVAPRCQFAPVYDAESLARWIEAAPGLDYSCYWLARRRDGRLAGFFGLWDQASFKQLRVTGYSLRLAAVRTAFNTVAPLMGATPLPPPGAPLRYLTAVHICVPAGEPATLRALLIHAYNGFRVRGYSFVTLGLDVRDPLGAALPGLLAQPTDVHAYITLPAGRYTGPALDTRPLHYEIALV
jgi:GNAT superfamily N-acetyltransferase